MKFIIVLVPKFSDIIHPYVLPYNPRLLVKWLKENAKDIAEIKSIYAIARD